MNLLPIVQRELSVASRRRLTYWLRVGFAILASGIGGVVFLTTRPAPAHEVARALFHVLIWLSLVYCLGYGIRSTADCLSAEKREGTLGLLFLTNLGGHDVVLGKTASSSIAGLQGLLATFPILALTLMFGGVSASHLWRVLLVLIDTFLFSLAIGVFASALTWRAPRAMFGTGALLIFFSALLPGVAALIREFARSGSRLLTSVLSLPSPIYALLQAKDTATGSTLPKYWLSVGCIAGLSIVFIALASWIVPRSWQVRTGRTSLQNWPAQWRIWADPDSAGRTQRLERNPIVWLFSRRPSHSASLWGLLAGWLCLWELGCLASGRQWHNDAVYLLSAIILNLLFKCWAASAAGRQLAEDRQSGALELVISTPLSVQRILWGQWQAFARKCFGPVLVVLVIEGTFLAATLQRDSSALSPITPRLWAVGMLTLLIDLPALSWVGMWGAMTLKNPNRVTSTTLLRIQGTFLILFGMFQCAGALLIGLGLPFSWEVNIALWVGVGLLVDIGFGWAAWWQLRHGFRQFACSRYVPVPSRFSLASLRRQWWMPG